MAHRTLDLSKKTIRINLARDTFRQSTSVNTDGLINRSRQLVRVQRAGTNVVLTYFDHHSLTYIIKTVENTDPKTGEPKKAFIAPVTWNAEKVQKFKGLSDHLELSEQAQVPIQESTGGDLSWKSDVRFFGIRDALLGEPSYRSRLR